MFILNTNEVGTALFAEGQKVESDIDLWHKWFGHVNFPRLREMQTKSIVFGLLKFSGCNGQVCEAYQLKKQHRLPFPNEHNQSRNSLNMIHSYVWEPAQNVVTKLRACVCYSSDHRGLGLGRTFDKLSKDDDVNVESRKAMLHYKRTIFCTLREEDKLE